MFNNPFSMVVAIVLIVSIARILTAIYGRRDHQGVAPPQDNAETARLRDEVKQLKDRISVLERITVEKENSLERQIEALRDS